MNRKKSIVYLDRSQLEPHPDNPRKDLGDLTELRESIRQNGITVTVINAFMGYDDPDEGHEEPPTPPKPDNPPPESPNTDDPFRMTLYITLAAVSVVALTGLVIAYRKMKKRYEQ